MPASGQMVVLFTVYILSTDHSVYISNYSDLIILIIRVIKVIAKNYIYIIRV